MGFIDTIANRFGYTRKAARQFPTWALQTAEAQQYSLPNPSIYENQAHLYRTLSWIGTAIDITAQSAAVVPGSVMQNEGEKKREVLNHAF